MPFHPDAVVLVLPYCPLKSHGRDNKLHVWKLHSQTSSTVLGSALAPGSLTPEIGYSLDVNALNFCRFSLLCLDVVPPSADMRALVAVPNLVESSLASASSSLCREAAMWLSTLTRLISGLSRPWREYTQPSEEAIRIPRRYLDPTAEE
jgi:hypothetical protein